MLRALRSRSHPQSWASASAVARQSTTLLQQLLRDGSAQPAALLSTDAGPHSDPADPAPASDDTAEGARVNAWRDFKRATARRQPVQAEAALEALALAGGVVSRSAVHETMGLYLRCADSDAVLRLLRSLLEVGPAPNQHSFGYALSALKRAGYAGRIPTAAAADAALALFSQMRSLGLPPNGTLYNELIDCVGKAGRLKEAFQVFGRSLADGIAPTAHTFSILIKACAVAKDVDRAADTAFKLAPAHGVAPGPAAWNGVLGAAAAGASVDRCYEVWAGMVDAGVVPDVHTERILAKAFASHPQLAAELVAEARELRAQAVDTEAMEVNKGRNTTTSVVGDRDGIKGSNSGFSCEAREDGGHEAAAKGGEGAAVGRKAARAAPSRQLPILLDEVRRAGRMSAAALGLAAHMPGGAPSPGSAPAPAAAETATETPKSCDPASSFDAFNEEGLQAGTSHRQSMPPLATEAPSRLTDMLYLDLHGHSKAAARMALMRRLEALVEAWPQAQALQGGGDTDSSKHLPEGLVIITGIGRGSVDGVGVLRDAVREALREQGLAAADVAGNPGRLLVPWPAVAAFSEAQWERLQREHVFAAARARYLAVGAGVAALGAAALILPRLGPWLGT